MSTAASRLPAIDERLAVPETRFEVIGGEAVYVSPADPPHASLHAELSALLVAHIVPGYVAATDMLTRTSLVDDIAPDASVYPLGPDPETGGRQLEELAFEIASTQSLKNVAVKAASLSARGVRRVFAIEVEPRRAYEWSRRKKGWKRLPAGGAIADKVFARPLPVDELLSAASVDDALVRALDAKKNPVIMEIRAEERTRGASEGWAKGRAQGRAEGRAEAWAEARAAFILDLLVMRGVEVTDGERAHILSIRDVAVLDRAFQRALTCESAAALLSAMSTSTD